MANNKKGANYNLFSQKYDLQQKMSKKAKLFQIKNTIYNLNGEQVAAEGCLTYAPLSVGDNYKIKDWKVIYGQN